MPRRGRRGCASPWPSDQDELTSSTSPSWGLPGTYNSTPQKLTRSSHRGLLPKARQRRLGASCTKSVSLGCPGCFFQRVSHDYLKTPSYGSHMPPLLADPQGDPPLLFHQPLLPAVKSPSPPSLSTDRSLLSDVCSPTATSPSPSRRRIHGGKDLPRCPSTPRPVPPGRLCLPHAHPSPPSRA